MSEDLTIRPACADDCADIRRAIVELQEHERRLSATRLPGVAMADAYLAWLERQAAECRGLILVAELAGVFAGFAAGWVEEDDSIAETPDSNRFALVSDICVMPAARGRRIAERLITGLERHLAGSGVTRLRLSALALNAPAHKAYERQGFTPYEVVYEKPIDGVR